MKKEIALIRSTHTGKINLGGAEPVNCYVLEDGQRVLVASQIQGVLGASKNRHLGRVLERLPSESKALDVRPVTFVSPGGNAKGYTSSDVVSILRAFQRGFLRGELHDKQIPMAMRAMAAIEAFAEVGLAALIDEATGYQSVRAPDAMSSYFDRVFADRMAPWVMCFDSDWDQSLCKLYGYQYAGRPPLFVRGINYMTYRIAFGDDAAKHLSDVNKDPCHRRNHHQLLTPEAKTVLSNTIAAIKVLVKTSRNPKDFLAKIAAVFRGAPLQMEF